MATQTASTQSTGGQPSWYQTWQNTYGTNGGYANTAISTNGITTNGTSPYYGNTASQWSIASQGTIVGTPVTMDAAGKLQLKGDGADIEINGVKLSDTLNAINERLGIYKMNPELEKDFEELAELGRKYREKEEYFKERLKIIDLLEKD